MKILVVEDDFSSRKLMGLYLKISGEIDFAVNGVEAVEAFQSAIDKKEYYDIVFLDIMLPLKNGHEVLTEIKKIEEENEIFGFDGARIVMTSALNDGPSIKDAFKEQCDAYLTKPIFAEKMKKIMEDYFAKKD